MAEMAYYGLTGFFDAIGKVYKYSHRYDEDLCDKLNKGVSTVILVIMIVVVSCKQYVGEPIICWCPGAFTGAMIDYAHQICWVTNTYYLRPDEAPLTIDEPREHVLIYYQWVPMILLGQVLLFQIPGLVWKGASVFIGLDVNRLSEMLSGTENVNPEIRDRTVRAIVKQIDRSLAVSAWRSTGCCNTHLRIAQRKVCWLGCGKAFGNYLTILYIGIKCLCIVNTSGQLFVLNYLLGAERMGIHFLMFGYRIITQLARGEDAFLAESKIFPRVTMCDFSIRQMANWQPYSVQCTLPINLFNEKIFIIIWFWLVLLTICTIFNLVFWIGSSFSLSRSLYVRKYLRISEKMRRYQLDSRHMSCFVHEYLRQDGTFMLRMLAKNTTDVIVSEIVCKLWDNFILHHRTRKEFHRHRIEPQDEQQAEEQTELVKKRRQVVGATNDDTSKVLSPMSVATPGNIFPISGFLDGIGRIGKFAVRWDDDVFDRLNHRYSTIIVLIFTIIVSTKQYVGEPIVCWTPALFTGAMVEYAHQVCWVSNTYYLPPNEAPLTKDQPRVAVLVYYQWVPFILLAQAFLFQVTNLIWIAMSKKNGLDVNRLIMLAAAADNIYKESRHKTIKTMVQNIDQAIVYAHWKSKHHWLDCLRTVKNYLCCGRGYGNYLTMLYLLCKLLYIVNSVGQLYMLNYLLGAENLGVHFSWFGVYIMELLVAGKEVSSNSLVFPRVTMCDFKIRQFSNLQDWTVECALPINLFNEKFFIFLWFWITFMFFANVYSLISWLFALFTNSRVSYVKKYIKLIEKVNKHDYQKKHIACFAEEYLRHDGVFSLRMLANNTNDVLVAQVIAKLWSHYKLYHMHSPEFHKPHRRDPLDEMEEGPLLEEKPNHIQAK